MDSRLKKKENKLEAKNKVVFEIEKEERKYHFMVAEGAPLGEVYMVLGEMLDEVVRLINEHAEKRNKKEDEETVEE